MIRLRALARQPLSHFLLLGALIFALDRAFADPETRPPLVVDEAWVARVVADWRRETGRAPRPEELRASLEASLDEAVLIAEALRLDLDRRDPVAREVLIDHLRFTRPDRRGADAALLREARVLGMSRSDPVVRRRLVQLMRQRLAGESLADPEALTRYVEAHPERYGQPWRYTVEQVYFPPEAEAAEVDAALTALRQGQPPETLGAPLLLGARWAAQRESDLAQRYGESLATAVAEAEPGTWLGPVASPFGQHLLRVTTRHPPRPPDPATAGLGAAYRWQTEAAEARWRAALAELRRQYPVAWAVDLPGEAG